jgi:hypothetical protein
MRLNHGMIALMLSAAALASSMTGCGGNRVVYDPYGQDYHRWDPDEDRYYRRWEVTTNRNHMDFDRRSDDDRHAYWDWRHH